MTSPGDAQFRRHRGRYLRSKMAMVIRSQSPAEIAKRTWQLKNEMTTTLDPNSLNDDLSYEKPWENNPVYLKRVMISDLALLRIVMHAITRIDGQVVGLLHGKIVGDAFLVMDACAFPVDANLDAQTAQTSLLNHFNTLAQGGGLEDVVGWYRSDRGPRFVSSHTDISTQMQIQQLKAPCVVVLIDPARTRFIEKVPIGAFRTYPEGYTPLDLPRSDHIPEEFLKLTKRFEKRYTLDTKKFKSLCDNNLLDTLWNEYWPNTISSSTPGCNGISKRVPYPVSVGFERRYLKFPFPDYECARANGYYEYCVCLHFGLTQEHRSSTEASNELHDKLMVEAGSSPNLITATDGSDLFYAILNEKQAMKLAKSEHVKGVRTIIRYH